MKSKHQRKSKRYPTTIVDSALWQRFMSEIARRKGIRRGVIQESLEEAIVLWLSREDDGDDIGDDDGQRNPR